VASVKILPRLVKVHQQFDAGRIENIPLHLGRRLASWASHGVDLSGREVAIAIGSRGITDILEIVTVLIDFLRDRGARPFLLPAMGSHGGATAEGQRAILEGYGLTREKLGVEIRSSMDVVEVGATRAGLSVYCDRVATEVDGLILVNRIHAHTDFEARYESGLVKMIAIGLGKRKGAQTIHRLGARGFREEMVHFAEVSIAHLPLLFGIGIVENAYNRTARLEVIDRDRIFEMEPPLLREAKRLQARILLDHLDVLVVGEMGKDISGTGMDTSVIGRRMIFGEPEPTSPRIKRIVVLSLSEKTHGNAVGIGLADICTRRLVERIDFESTYVNTITATSIERGKLPLQAETDREAIEIALDTCWVTDRRKAIMAVIRDTKSLETIRFSEVALPLLQGLDHVEVIGRPEEMQFDDNGTIVL